MKLIYVETLADITHKCEIIFYLKSKKVVKFY